MLTPEAKAGDYVLVHAGQSLEVIEAEDAADIWKYLEIGEGQNGEHTKAKA
jgi:hydrogenase maturation factor